MRTLAQASSWIEPAIAREAPTARWRTIGGGDSLASSVDAGHFCPPACSAEGAGLPPVSPMFSDGIRVADMSDNPTQSTRRANRSVDYSTGRRR